MLIYNASDDDLVAAVGNDNINKEINNTHHIKIQLHTNPIT